jgi:hypothetical protein
MAVEEWRIVAGFDNYEVSNTGLIRNRSTGDELRQRTDRAGYYRVNLHRDGMQKTKRIHKLVAAAFLGDPEGDREVDHIDRNRSNNNIENLRYVSKSENGKNRGSHHGVQYKYVDTLPDGAIVVEEYNDHIFEDLHYHGGNFYFYNGVQYRVVHRNLDSRSNSYSIMAVDVDGNRVRIAISKYQRLIGEM